MQKKTNYKKLVRLWIYPHTEEYIRQIALDYDCKYGDKPSIARLLSKIEEGQLLINKATFNLKSFSDSSIIAFRIEVPRYLIGTISIISKKIADYKANIKAVKTKSRHNFGIVEFFLSLAPDIKLSSLIVDLKSIKIKQVAHLNDRSELKLIASDFQFAGPRIKVNTVDNFLEKTLISDLVCVVGFRLIVKDEVGVLAKVANQIAQTKLLIYSISENIGNNLNEAIIKLYLYLRSESNITVTEQIDNLNLLLEQINKMTEVKDIEPLGVDSLD